MEIIKLEKNHIKNALELIWNVFLEFEAPDYSKQGIEEFKKFISYNSILENFEKGKFLFWGCFINEDLVGVIATRDNSHISLLFVKKEYHKRGIARSLFQKVEERCKCFNDISQITVNSSPYAVEVYHRLGFVDIDEEQTVNGIRFTPMSFLLK